MTEGKSEDQKRLEENPELVAQMERTAQDPDSRIHRGRPGRERLVDSIGEEQG